MSASHLVHMHVTGFMPGEIFCSVQSSEVKDLIKYPSKSGDRHTCLNYSWQTNKATYRPSNPMILHINKAISAWIRDFSCVPEVNGSSVVRIKVFEFVYQH